MKFWASIFWLLLSCSLLAQDPNAKPNWQSSDTPKNNQSFDAFLYNRLEKKTLTEWLQSQEIVVQPSAYNQIELAASKEIKNQLSNEFGGLGAIAGKAFVNMTEQNQQAQINAIKEQELQQRKANKLEEIVQRTEKFHSLLASRKGELTTYTDESYFYVLSVLGDSTHFSLFNVFKDRFGIVPYRQEMMAAFNAQYRSQKAYLIGPFANINEARQDIINMAKEAHECFYTIGLDRVFVYQQYQWAPDEVDWTFWGMNTKTN